jgi:hypothetical protein
MGNKWALSVALLVGLAGCAQPRQAAHSIRVNTEAEAGILGTNLAMQRGIDLQQYQQPAVHFDAVAREWTFVYRMNPPTPIGGHFMIRVDASGKTHFGRGA